MRNALGAVDSVLVLGGTSDIGIDIAKALVRDGASKVVLAGRDSSRLNERADEVREAGGRQVETLHFDALDLESHTGVIEEAFSRFEDVDVVILAFGLLGNQEQGLNEVKAALPVVMTNYVAAVSTGVPLMKVMEKQGHGTIVVLSSVAGERARRANFTYGSSKAGLDAFWQGASMHLQESGVHVLIVRPGFVKTKMTAGLHTPPLSTDAKNVAEAVSRALVKGEDVVWVPAGLRWVMTVIRHLPRKIFARMKF